MTRQSKGYAHLTGTKSDALELGFNLVGAQDALELELAPKPAHSINGFIWATLIELL